jgi:glycosyltransferase involved in cell wall biosynthesis
LKSSLLLNLAYLGAKPTGIATYTKNLFPQLRSLNPTLLTARPISNFPCYTIPENLTPEQGSKGHFNRLKWTQFQLPKIYRKLQANLVFSPLPEAPLFSGCRSIVTVHDLIPLRFPRRFSPLTLYARYYEPLVLKQAEHIICDSVSTANDVIHYFKIPEHKITPILLAHDADHFRFLDLPTQNYFLYLGRIDPYKNLQRLITAFSALPNHSNYQLWIVGPADRRYTPALIAHAEQLNLTNQIKFLDYLPYAQLPTVINQAMALVFPTLWEGFGLPVLEAMACGTPVITSNLSSVPEVAGDAALMINPYQVSEITEAMEAIVNNSELRAQYRTLGMARASQFSWEKTGRDTAAVLAKYL